MPPPIVTKTPEADAQYKKLPYRVAQEVNRLKEHLEKNPYHLPHWYRAKLMWEEHGKKAFRVVIGDYRVSYTFDGDEVKVTRIRHRPRMEYSTLRKP